MKLLFDQNLSLELVRRLQTVYPESQHVGQLGMQRASDEEIWDFALSSGIAIVSKDSDFYHRSTRGHTIKCRQRSGKFES